MPIKPGSIIECDRLGPHGKPVVAVIGLADFDWAAYEQAYPDQVTPAQIADLGNKILAEQARNLFPELSERVYRN